MEPQEEQKDPQETPVVPEVPEEKVSTEEPEKGTEETQPETLTLEQHKKIVEEKLEQSRRDVRLDERQRFAKELLLDVQKQAGAAPAPQQIDICEQAALEQESMGNYANAEFIRHQGRQARNYEASQQQAAARQVEGFMETEFKKYGVNPGTPEFDEARKEMIENDIVEFRPQTDSAFAKLCKIKAMEVKGNKDALSQTRTRGNDMISMASEETQPPVSKAKEGDFDSLFKRLRREAGITQ